MNRLLVSFLSLALSLFAINASHAQQDEVSVTLADAEASVSYPLSVMAIINNKCYGCHSPEGKNIKAKKALKWVELQGMDAMDVLGVMDEIVEVVDEGKMPPKKIVAKYPDMELTADEAAKLKAWAEATLMKFDE